MAKQSLGKGLGALLGDKSTEDIIAPKPALKPGEYVESIKIVEIEPNPEQPRTDFDEESLEELAASIREHGVITPIIVKKAYNGFYQIVAGERRWRASKKAGLKKIPAIVKELSDIETQEIALIENLQRKDLNPVEEALGYKKLMDEFSLTQDEISKKMGKSRSSVANSLRLLSLSEEVIKLLRNGDISFGHAKVILSAETKKKQEEIAKAVIKEGLSVRATEELIKKNPSKVKKPKKQDLNVELAIKDIERAMSSSIGTNVKIASKGNKGTVQIEYYSSEELERIIKFFEK